MRVSAGSTSPLQSLAWRPTCGPCTVSFPGSLCCFWESSVHLESAPLYPSAPETEVWRISRHSGIMMMCCIAQWWYIYSLYIFLYIYIVIVIAPPIPLHNTTFFPHKIYVYLFRMSHDVPLIASKNIHLLLDMLDRILRHFLGLWSCGKGFLV